MAQRMTASEAREIAWSHNCPMIVDAILAAVRMAAERGETSLKYRDHGFGSGALYTTEDKYPEHLRAVMRELHHLGYEVSVHSHDGSIAVDIWLQVKWGGK